MNEAEINRLLKDKKKALRKHDLKELVQICNLRGVLLAQSGRYEDAISEHEEEREYCGDDLLGVAVAWRKIGECYCSMGQFEEALSNQRQHLSLATACESVIEQQRAWATIGRTYLMQAESTRDTRIAQGALTNAEKAFLSSLEACAALKATVSGNSMEKLYMEMKARLYLNLGLVYDSQDLASKCEEHLQRAVEISKRFQLIPDLFRCYLSLSTIAQKHENPSQAIDYAESAVKCAKDIKDKHLEVDAFVQKGQVLTQLSDFSGGKHFFKKALKMGSSTEEDSSKIKKYYRAAKKMLDVAEILEDETDNEKRLDCYDQLGDGAAELSNYKQAIEFYEKMLECCEELNRTDEALIPIYVSLAQTYMDDKNYAKAIEYFRKELHLRQGNSEQECRTWLNIAEAQEYQGLDYKHLQKSYKTAFDHARKVKHQQLMVQVLTSLIIVATYFKMDVHIKETTKHLHQIKQRYNISENDITSDEGESQQTTDIEVSDISDLSDSDTDISDQEEAGRPVENVTRTSGTARVARKSRTTRNEKGETPLHRAAIEGNMKKVQKLVEQGHPVNPRDFCGWLPIHEAANYDHADIVEYLISHGAAVNDRGDTKCKGVTPLIDAAICGHVDMMMLLINKGANIIMKDDEGMTALDHLITWRESQEDFLSEDLLSETRNAEKLLQEKMRGLGATPSTESKKKSKNLKRKSSSSLFSPDNHREDDRETRTPNKTTPDGRGSDTVHRIESDTGHRSSSRRKSGDDMEVSTYKEAMLSMGSATQRSVKKIRPNSAVTSSSSRPALLDGNDDEWLIEDMEEANSRKRKRAEGNELFTTIGSRSKPPDSDERQKRARSYENEAWIDMDLDDAEISDRNACEEADDNVPTVIINPEETDVSDAVSENDSIKSLPSLNQPNHRRRNRVRQLRLTNFTVPTRVLTESCSNSNDSYDSGLSSTPSGHKVQERFVMRLKIKVKDQLFLIPVSSRVSQPTVMWLNQELSQRYYTLNGLRPFLTLYMKDGAILSAEDDVTMLLSPDEELDARINGWDLPIITERYAQACKSLNAVPYENVKAILEKTEASGVLSLGNLSLRPAQLQPVLRAIQFQNNLREINLQGNRLADIGLESLARMIESLPILSNLDLSYNEVTTVGLQHFSSALKKASASVLSNEDSEKPLQQLTSLVLASNPLGDGCSSHICSILTCLPQLSTLNLSSCGLTAKFIQHNRDQLAQAIQSSSLHRLDVSGNKFCSFGGELLLNCLISSRVVALDLSSTVLPSGGINNLAQSLQKFLSQDMCALEELYISDCHFSTEDGSVIGRFPACCTTLRRIHLSSNSKLQKDAFTQLLESAINSQLEHIEMNHCGIVSPLDYLSLDGIINKLAATTPLTTLVFTCRGLDTADIECLQQIWASKWAERSAMTFKGNSVKLSVTDSS